MGRSVVQVKWPSDHRQMTKKQDKRILYTIEEQTQELLLLLLRLEGTENKRTRVRDVPPRLGI
jgi:hypothetical protein